MSIFRRIVVRLLGLTKRKKNKKPYVFVSELDLTKGFMVVSDTKQNKMINIDLKGNRGYQTFKKLRSSKKTNRLSKSCSDIGNEVQHVYYEYA